MYRGTGAAGTRVAACCAGAGAAVRREPDVAEEWGESLFLGAVEVTVDADVVNVDSGASGVADTVSPAWWIADSERVSEAASSVDLAVSNAAPAPPANPTSASPASATAARGSERRAMAVRGGGMTAVLPNRHMSTRSCSSFV